MESLLFALPGFFAKKRNFWVNFLAFCGIFCKKVARNTKLFLINLLIICGKYVKILLYSIIIAQFFEILRTSVEELE